MTGKRDEGGFTLLELLVVLAILGLAIGMVTSRGPMRSARLEGRAGAAQFADALRRAGLRALETGQRVTVVIDPARGEYATDGDTKRVFARGLTPHLRPGTQALPHGLAEIVFSPDGSASGGGIDLTGQGGSLSVAVEWLTGSVTVTHEG
jgi:general secretion pathway protein H